MGKAPKPPSCWALFGLLSLFNLHKKKNKQVSQHVHVWACGLVWPLKCIKKTEKKKVATRHTLSLPLGPCQVVQMEGSKGHILYFFPSETLAKVAEKKQEKFVSKFNMGFLSLCFLFCSPGGGGYIHVPGPWQPRREWVYLGCDCLSPLRRCLCAQN